MCKRNSKRPLLWIIVGVRYKADIQYPTTGDGYGYNEQVPEYGTKLTAVRYNCKFYSLNWRK